MSERERRRVRLGREVRCPLCRQRFVDEALGPLLRCAGCGTIQHRQCREELGGCSTLGCPESAAAGAPPRSDPGDAKALSKAEAAEGPAVAGAPEALGPVPRRGRREHSPLWFPTLALIAGALLLYAGWDTVFHPTYDHRGARTFSPWVWLLLLFCLGVVRFFGSPRRTHID